MTVPAEEPGELIVSDLMSRDVITVHVQDSLAAAGVLMQRAGIRHLPVLDGDRVIGVVTDVQVASGLRALCWSTLCEPVSSAMSRDVVRVHPRTSARSAARQLENSASGALVVVENGRLVGLLSGMDVVRAVADARDARSVITEDRRSP
ncbi:MAG: putative signal transduction protein with domain [Frankiales bacterium]|nr:putative signal transduction protein with domain [Frankiales bacterium]